MDRGLYAALSGGMLEKQRLDIVANNLANVNTVGFKAQNLVARQQDFADTLASVIPGTPTRAASDHVRTPGAVSIGTATDFSLGPLSQTENPLHVALNRPDHFFVVETEQGTAYTRAGNFTLNSEGQLVTVDGLPVQGEAGPIIVQNGSPRITSNGSVMVGSQSVGKLRTVKIDDLTQLTRTDGVRFKLEKGQAAVVDPELTPESLEMPNTNVVSAMVEMIDLQRSFEAYGKTVKEISDLNDNAIRTARSG